ncbi:unnamed protein product, partial [Rotaria magnacalcarata]
YCNFIVLNFDGLTKLTIRDIVPFPQVPLQLENFVHVAQLPSIGHGCVALHDVILIGDPTQ